MRDVLQRAGAVFLLILISACLPVFSAPSAPALQILPAQAFQDTPISCSLAADGLIRYTLDGSEPGLNRGEVYRGPFKLNHTTVVRAASFSEGQRISAIATQTYLFLDEVLRQPESPPGLPSGSEAWNEYPSAYQMDPRVVNDPSYRDQLKPALRSLPTLSVVCPMQDLFGSKSGLYLHTTRRGEGWEKAISVEWIQTNGSRGFQIDCGLRVQGNYGRLPEKSPKHSFRLLFKERYGASKLKYPVFPDSKIQKFDTLVLRADYNNSWTHWQHQDQVRAQRIRDAWLKDSHRAMGAVAAHNRYVHLYLNGLYWGIYDLAERPDASFAAAYLGGSKEEFDVLDESGVKSGDPKAFEAMQTSPWGKTGTLFERVSKRLDLTQYIDYLLLNYYAGNGDWGEYKNWYAIRRRAEGETFRYYVWDGEMILQSIRDDAVNRPGRPPFGVAQALFDDPEFKRVFAERVQRHCFGDGALTPAACIERWRWRSAEVELAIIAESARWGYYRGDVPYTRDREWMKEQSRLVDHYFPHRTTLLIRQLQAAGLYPTPPVAAGEEPHAKPRSREGGGK